MRQLPYRLAVLAMGIFLILFGIDAEGIIAILFGMALVTLATVAILFIPEPPKPTPSRGPTMDLTALYHPKLVFWTVIPGEGHRTITSESLRTHTWDTALYELKQFLRRYSNLPLSTFDHLWGTYLALLKVYRLKVLLHFLWKSRRREKR
ncbi:hypothetical protein [Candidatus Caldatribacterium sp.]|uniref:hypothetical protein n=1 Tax=Candidatus Caldatribacterium sp. TaxID=2282143 RepID=UPI0038486CFA|nr:hypothetical protein [Candidatus Caldatribacterium sp.]